MEQIRRNLIDKAFDSLPENLKALVGPQSTVQFQVVPYWGPDGPPKPWQGEGDYKHQVTAVAGNAYVIFNCKP